MGRLFDHADVNGDKVLNPDEVLHLLAHVQSVKQHAILTTCYAAGLRVSEAIRLKAAAIDNKRMVIRVQQGKGQKDRYVMLSPKLLDTLHSADPGSQFGTQQACVGSFVREPSNGCELLVDGIRGQTPRFEVHAIAHDHNAVEGQPRLGAIPGDELVDGVLVNAARRWRAEATEHRSFAMIQIG